MAEAFFLPDGERYIPTELTRGPWSPSAQHGGPPCALLGTVMEQRHPREGMQVVRFTVEILRPVPIAPLTIRTRMSRPGRSVELLEGTLSSGEQEILRASAVRIRTTAPLPLEVPREELRTPPSPQESSAVPFFDTGMEVGYHTAMEFRFARGAFIEPGPATAWLRMRHPLVAGEDISPLARVLIAADSGNGVSSVLDLARWLFINPDLTVYLHRLPVGEWVCLDARTTVESHGVGLAESNLYDEQGPIGRGLQSLFISERSPPA